MKVDIYNKLMALQASRRQVLHGAVALGATTMLSGLPGMAQAASGSIRAEILISPLTKSVPSDSIVR